MKIFTNGCFDVIHRGHIDLLEFSKSFGDVTVGLNSDESVKRLKGEGRPFNSQENRKRVLESIRYVDRVIIFDEDTPYELIRLLSPDLIVKGGDYLASDVVGADLCPVRIFDTVQGFSTTMTLGKMNKSEKIVES